MVTPVSFRKVTFVPFVHRPATCPSDDGRHQRGRPAFRRTPAAPAVATAGMAPAAAMTVVPMMAVSRVRIFIVCSLEGDEF